MAGFREFVVQQDFVEFITENFDKPSIPTNLDKTADKPWSAGKDEVLQTWKTLHPSNPDLHAAALQR
jgi:hypothetical protein